jgi:hypothetical protein
MKLHGLSILDLILPFDTPLVFWGIFWLNGAKAKIRKSP